MGVECKLNHTFPTLFLFLSLTYSFRSITYTQANIDRYQEGTHLSKMQLEMLEENLVTLSTDRERKKGQLALLTSTLERESKAWEEESITYKNKQIALREEQNEIIATRKALVEKCEVVDASVKYHSEAVEGLRAKKAKQESTIHSVLEKKEEVSIELHNLLQERTRKEAHISELKKRKAKLEKARLREVGEIRDLNRSRELHEGSINTNRSKFEEETKNSTVVLRDLSVRLNELRSEVEATHIDTRQRFNDLQEELLTSARVVSQERNDKSGELSLLNGQVKKLITQTKDTRNEVFKTEKNVEALKERLEAKRKEVEKVLKEKEEMEEENSKLLAECNEMERQIANVSQKVTKEEAKKTELLEVVEEKRQISETLKERWQFAEGYLECLRSQLEGGPKIDASVATRSNHVAEIETQTPLWWMYDVENEDETPSG